MCEDMLRLTMLWLMLLLLCGQSIKGQRAAFPGGARSPCLLTLFLWAIKGTVYAPTAGEQPADLPSPLLSLNGCKLISSLLLIPASLSQDSYSLSFSLSLPQPSVSILFSPSLVSSYCFSLLPQSPLCFSTGPPRLSPFCGFCGCCRPSVGKCRGCGYSRLRKRCISSYIPGNIPISNPALRTHLLSVVHPNLNFEHKVKSTVEQRDGLRNLIAVRMIKRRGKKWQ